MIVKKMKQKGILRKLLILVMAVVIVFGLYIPVSSPAVAKGSGSPEGSLPQVSPTPQMIKLVGPKLTIPHKVLLFAGDKADQSAVDLVKKTFQDLGVQVIDANHKGNEGKHRGNVKVYVGGAKETPKSSMVLASLGRKGPEQLPNDGYVLAIERNRGIQIVLSGKDHIGTYYAALTLKQLFRKKGGKVQLPSVYVRDFPAFALRGGEESFYGPVWSWAERYDQIDFLSAHKMNYYFYGPAGDSHTTGQGWRNLYSSSELKKFRKLIHYAKSHHVKFMYRIGPEAKGNNSPWICHSSKSDRQALVKRLEQMYSIGVHSFVISWDDVTGSFSCKKDKKRYGSGDVALAKAQAGVLNYLQKNFFDVHPNIQRELTIPTQYYGDSSTPYRSTFDKLTTNKMDIYWTGSAVVSNEIKKHDALKVKKAFPRHRIVIFDNYPVNDYNTNRLMMGPLDNRGANLHQYVSGISWNEMLEERASHIPLFTEAEYAWNPSDYNPEKTWNAALHEIGGEAYPALKVFADVNRYNKFLGKTQAPDLGEFIDAVKQKYLAGKNISNEAAALDHYLDQLAAAPSTLRNKMPKFAKDVGPWLDKVDVTVPAVRNALSLLKAMAKQDKDLAKTAYQSLKKSVKVMNQNPKEIAVGIVNPFTNFAIKEYEHLQNRYMALSVPYGSRVFPRGGTATVKTTLTASYPGTLNGTLTITAPHGWSVKNPTQKVSLQSNGRTVEVTFQSNVTLAKDASSGVVKFTIHTNDGRSTTFKEYGKPVTPSSLKYKSLIMSSDPNGYWRLDDTGDRLIDSSGNGQNGVYHGKVTRVVPGVTDDGDTSIQLNGGYADVPSSPQVSPTGPFTIESWVKPEIVAGGPGMGIVEKYTTPANNGFALRLNGANKLTAFTLSKTTYKSVTGGPSIGTGVWHYVAAVYDGDLLTIYLDGVKLKQVEDHVTPSAGPVSMKIGARGDDAGRRFVGGIDEVALYPQALSTKEIEQHFLAGMR